MPTLCFDASFNSRERRILTKAFKSNCAELGISRHDCSIHLRRGGLGPIERRGMMTRPAADFFLIVLNTIDSSLASVIATLSHEMVHVKQYLIGELVDSPCGNVVWHGRLIDRTLAELPMLYTMLPWEQEAHGRMDYLCNRAMEALDSQPEFTT